MEKDDCRGSPRLSGGSPRKTIAVVHSILAKIRGARERKVGIPIYNKPIEVALKYFLSQ
jgi:hypothetical protein